MAIFFFLSQKEHKSKAETAKERPNGLLKRLFDSSWWTDCAAEKGWRWMKDDVSAGKTVRMERFQKIRSISPSCHYWIGSVNTHLKFSQTTWCTSPLDGVTLSFIRLFVKGTDPLLCSLHIQFPVPFSTKLAVGWTHTQKKLSRLHLCKHSINPWSAWVSWWFVCAHLGLKSSDMRWMWSSLTFWEAPSALQSIWNAVCSRFASANWRIWVKLNFHGCKCVFKHLYPFHAL